MLLVCMRAYTSFVKIFQVMIQDSIFSDFVFLRIIASSLLVNYFTRKSEYVNVQLNWFFHWVNSFQYNVTHHTLASDDNGILFMFELSPITVKYFTDSPNMFDFLVQISSIIGGIFMFLRVIDMYFFNMFTKFLGGH